MNESNAETAPVAEGYFRGKWAIYLYEKYTNVLEVYRMFPENIQQLVSDDTREELRSELINRYSTYPNVTNLDETVKEALDTLLQGQKLIAELEFLHFEDPYLTEPELLLEHARKVTSNTPIELIMSAYDWTNEGKNS